MKYDKERHKELVKLLLDYESKGKDFKVENEDGYFELACYHIIVDEKLFRTYQENFTSLMKNLLDNAVNFAEFQSAFSILYMKVREDFKLLKNNLEYIENFEPSVYSYEFAIAMFSIYSKFEKIQNQNCTEQEVTNYVREIYLELQELEE